MEFKQTTIAPAGRNKYGNYYSSGNITKSVVSTTYAGNDTTTTIGGGGQNDDSGETDFYCILSQTNATFNAVDLVEGATAATQVIAYRGYNKAATFVCDMDSVSATTEDGAITNLEVPDNMGIRNVPCGMTASFINNGTSASTIVFTADNTVTGNSGSLFIPVCVYRRNDNIPLPDDLYNWYEHKDDCELVWLEYVWNINRNATSTYIMDLSNEKAGVNVSATTSEGDILYPNSIATLTCTASTWMNGALVTGITYSIFTQPRFNARGVSITNTANTGVLVWDQNTFNFSGPTLPIDIIATKDGNTIATKTMTIEKNYPGGDGTPAHTRYINTDANIVVFDPETSGFTPSSVTATVWLQIGNDLPIIDNQTTIYQWYNGMETGKTSAQGSLTANLYLGVSSVTFALRNENNQYYETEDIPVVPKGTPGPAGPSGSTGPSGESAWYLTLSNDNASINCDSDGNILSGAIRPTCQAKLYHGAVRQTNAVFIVDVAGASGVTSATTNGILTLTFGSGFDFTGSTLSISISGSSSGEVRDAKIMNVTKSYAGENGDDAITYWLEVSYGDVLYDPNTHQCSPESITVTGYKQIGQGAVLPAADATIKYKWQRRSTGAFTTESTYSTPISITTANCETYSRLRFTLYVGNTQVDMEDVDIMRNGLDGTAQEGRRGAAIRGPYSWDEYSASTRCWCAGESGGSCTECEKWIDVIYKDNKYYYCNTTYYGKLSPWNSVSSAWTSGDSFDFVATQLLLAENAKIYFLTNNELYLTDENGDITGGARGGSGTTFWAGAEEPGDAPFRVDTEGNIYAQKGVFAGYVQYPYTFVSDLMPNLQVSASNVSARYLADTTWKGRLPQAPENPENGWTYANTVEHQIYYYTTSRWSMVYETGNQDGYLADGNAYLVSDATNLGTPYEPVRFFLPAPTSAWNGFTYEIIVEPSLSRMDGIQQLEMVDWERNEIYCYAYAELRIGDMFRLTGGKYQITCMPKHGQSDVIYRWAITQATGGLDVVNDYGTAVEKTEYISTLVGTSFDTPLLVHKVLSYTGSTKPTVPGPTNTMFVKL